MIAASVALARIVTGDTAPAGKAIEFEKVLRERPDADGLRFLSAQMLGKDGVVLLVDQFEETYALCENEAERAAFLYQRAEMFAAQYATHAYLLGEFPVDAALFEGGTLDEYRLCTTRTRATGSRLRPPWRRRTCQ